MKSIFAMRGNGLVVGRLPSCPTSALPGTAEKVEVMRQRVERGELAFHPADAKQIGDNSPGIPAELCLPVTDGYKTNDQGGRYDRVRDGIYRRRRMKMKRWK